MSTEHCHLPGGRSRRVARHTTGGSDPAGLSGDGGSNDMGRG